MVIIVDPEGAKAVIFELDLVCPVRGEKFVVITLSRDAPDARSKSLNVLIPLNPPIGLDRHPKKPEMYRKAAEPLSHLPF